MAADSAFWRSLRTDFESLQPHQFSLMWNSRCLDIKGEPLGDSHWSWLKFPDASLKARLSAIALIGARALGYDSEDAWYDQLRTAEFVRFKLAGSTRDCGPDGAMVDKFGPIHDVVRESITLCRVLEAGAGSLGHLPELTESSKRKLVVQWDALLDRHRLLEQDVDRYASASDQIRRLAVSKPPETTGRWSQSWFLQHHRAKQESGISPSVAAAEERFTAFALEYWPLWESAGARYETYRDQLAVLQQQALAELASIWKGRSDAAYRWYEIGVAPAIEQALTALAKQRVAQARDIEMQRLEHPPSTARTATGNSILDEIYAGGDDPEAIRRLIENGGENLSPAAQRALALSGVSPPAVALGPTGPGAPVTQESAPGGPVTNEPNNQVGGPKSVLLPAPSGAARSVPDSAPVIGLSEVLSQTSQEVARALEGTDLNQISNAVQVTARAFERPDLNPELFNALAETATVKLDPELLKSLEVATIGFESTLNALAGLDWSAVAAAFEANQADMARMDQALGGAVPLTPRNRDEEVALLRRFSTDPKGLGLTEQQFYGLETASQWLELYRAWERSRLNATQAKGKGGRPLKDQTRDIHEAWVKMGKPKQTAEVCDRIAKIFFGGELKGALGSAQHRKVRERVRQALRRFERRAAT
jgi:hypothetical protein